MHSLRRQMAVTKGCAKSSQASPAHHQSCTHLVEEQHGLLLVLEHHARTPRLHKQRSDASARVPVLVHRHGLLAQRVAGDQAAARARHQQRLAQVHAADIRALGGRRQHHIELVHGPARVHLTGGWSRGWVVECRGLAEG
jgi:hypothetical protein